MAEPTEREPMSNERCTRCDRDVNGTPHRAMCGHPLKPITVDELAEIRATYESGGVAALGYSQVARLLDEIDRLADMLAAHLALESTDAAAGSYAGRAEEAEAEVKRLRSVLLDLPREWEATNNAVIGDRNYWEDRAALAMAERDAAIARAEQAEVVLAELRERLGKTGEQWGVRTRDDDPDEDIEVVSSEAIAREFATTWRSEIPDANPTAMCRTARTVGPWRVADATPRTAPESAADEQRDVDADGGCLCPHSQQPDGTLTRDGVLAVGCPLHDPDAGGGDGGG